MLYPLSSGLPAKQKEVHFTFGQKNAAKCQTVSLNWFVIRGHLNRCSPYLGSHWDDWLLLSVLCEAHLSPCQAAPDLWDKQSPKHSATMHNAFAGVVAGFEVKRRKYNLCSQEWVFLFFQSSQGNCWDQNRCPPYWQGLQTVTLSLSSNFAVTHNNQRLL